MIYKKAVLFSSLIILIIFCNVANMTYGGYPRDFSEESNTIKVININTYTELARLASKFFEIDKKSPQPAHSLKDYDTGAIFSSVYGFMYHYSSKDYKYIDVIRNGCYIIKILYKHGSLAESIENTEGSLLQLVLRDIQCLFEKACRINEIVDSKPVAESALYNTINLIKNILTVSKINH